MNSSALKGVPFALLAFGFYSSHDVGVKYLGGQMSVFQIILFANLFAIIPMNAMMLLDRSTQGLRPRRPGWVLIRTVSSIVSLICGFYAFTVLPLAETYALLFAMPLLITLLAVPLLGERLGIYRIGAIILGLLGVLVVLRPGFSAFSLGHAAALVSATSSALTSVIMRKIGNEERSAVLIMFPMIAGILLMGALMPWHYTPIEGSDLAVLALIGVLVMFAHLSMIQAYRLAPAGLIAPIQYSQMLWAIGYGYMFFDEVPDKWVALGAVIIICSGLIVVLREGRANVSRTAPVTRSLNLRPDKGPALSQSPELLGD